MLEIVALLFALTFMFSLTASWLDNQEIYLVRAGIGVVFGSFGVINLIAGLELLPGVVIDMRSPLILVAGIYGGGIAAFISAIMIALYRIFGIGGIGTVGGVGSILTVAAFATYCHWKIPRPNIGMWGLMGVISVGISVVWGYLTLPREAGQLFLRNFVPVSIVLYPLVTVVLGKLIDSENNRIQMRKNLHLSEQRFRAIFDEAFQFIGLLQPNGIVIETNKTALDFAGVGHEDVVGKYFWEAPWWSLSVDTQDKLKTSIDQASRGEFVRYRADVVGANDAVITIDFSLKPVFDASRKVVLIIPEGRNITSELTVEKQRLEIALERESNRILKEFIEDSSHHLRTPATIMKTSQYILKRNVEQLKENLHLLEGNVTGASKAQVINNFQRIMASCEQRVGNLGRSLDELVRLIEDLLELSQLDGGGLQLMEPIDVGVLIQELVEEYTPLAGTNGLRLNLSPPPHATLLHHDRRSLRLIFQNLIENAIRYTPSGGELHLRCTLDAPGKLVIHVEDNGIGIPQDEQENIFERFYRASNAVDHDSRGTGLGLAIVKRIVDQHKGTIAVESTLGEGTSFVLALPLQR